ncbi:S1C family serine protease [Nitriliruptor alkaliphilus]|uniref:S1C family serine protease n=1 Tax=Nitriliruptor alkaliphilus TaxID=427918 RepID=UPI000697F808|nr:trypsin-like peptidase domain-containing protein [Nitriliruptor alkaliphilus]
MAYDRDEWRTPWRVDDDRHDPVGAHGVGAAGSMAADADTSATHGPGVAAPSAEAPEPDIARYPQPPPSSWDAAAAGPGSPVGSVRPPDTTGTHDAPPAGSTRRGRPLLAGIVGGLVGALLGGGLVAAVVQDDGPGPLGGSASAPSITVNGEAGNVVPAVAEAVTPSVVRIDIPQSAVATGPLGAPGPALGSGVIYRSDGYILTNNHVVGEAETVTVRLASGDVLEAEVIGTDPLNDLAVIRVDQDGLPAINLRDTAESLVVGETVVAIGSPFGLDASVTTGIVSGLNRDLRVDDEEAIGLVIPSVIQTDAAINPGNSGGALVDGQGRLVGINTAILSRTGGNQGIGFAVPAEQAVASADQIIEQGFVRHPLLGVSGIDVSPDVAEQFGLEASRGAVVDAVQEGTGAEEAGVRSGDIIIAVDGEPLATMSQLVAEVRSRAPGDTVELTIVRGGDELTIEVTLSERPR